MQVDVLGGGPAGLYASLLLKRNHPNWDITIYERNPEGATYGWGVVFSDRTLSGFREADYPTFEEITENFVLWDAIDIHVKGELVRCNGHAFAGIGRQHLLNILHKRCVELGVTVHFETEMDIRRLPQRPDFVIAADGRNSLTRELYAETFKPQTESGNARYIWFGTDKVYDAFTFVFQETAAGLLQAHAYPFDATTSTFIVECNETTWQKAGLQELSEEESVQFCEEVFSSHLGIHRLLPNRSSWLTFETLKNRRWSHDNVVLLGDAVHTAHFSIGSGTKLAMEDAIALAEGFEVHSDIQSAFQHYEQARKPRQDIIQQAAKESQRYFETVSRYLDFDPLQFSFHLLTRSGRINWDNLRTRDPFFINDVERWFRSAAVSGNADKELLIGPPAIYTPICFRDLELQSRICVRQQPNDSSRDGMPDRSIGDQLQKLTASGAGLVMTEAVAVAPDGRISSGSPGMYTAEQEDLWTSYLSIARRHTSTCVGIEISHAGRRGATRPRAFGVDRPLRSKSWQLFAPSEIPYSHRSETPVEMTADDLDHVRNAFSAAAAAADRAGFDLLQIDMSHGYLLNSFQSPLTNIRRDEFGGALDNRIAFPLAIFDAVRAIWPERKPLSVAINASDWEPGGTTLNEAVRFATALKTSGCDFVAVRAGQTTIRTRPEYDAESLNYLTDVVRNDASIPTLATGYMTTSNQMNTLLAGGRTDLCVYTPPPGRG